MDNDWIHAHIAPMLAKETNFFIIMFNVDMEGQC